MPYYLEGLFGSGSLRQSIFDLILSPGARLREVDVAGVDADGVPVLLGSCEWTNSAHPAVELGKLSRMRRSGSSS